MPDKSAAGKSVLKVHILGVLSCAMIAGSSIYFAGNAIVQRRGLFLSARHELANTKSMLNESVTERTTLHSRVRILEQSTSEQLDLVSVKMLNARTADIVALAESVQFRVDSLQPEEQIRHKRVPAQPMQLIGSANADDVFQFLRLVGSQMPDVHIQSIDLVSTSFDSTVVQLNMQMYWFIDPADAD